MEIIINKPVYLGLSVLELSKILIYEFWYDYVNQNMVKFCYMDTNSFTVYVKDAIFKDIAEYVENRFDTSSYEIDRPLPENKIKKVTRLMKDKLGGKSWQNLFD